MNRSADNFGRSVRVGREVLSAPRVSVVIPAYNVAKYIAGAVDSVLAQTFRNFEIIVVNDGSPDTPAMERELGPQLEHIVYIKQPNRGAGPARNTAIDNARGELIAFLDADDEWLPEFLASQVKFLTDSRLDMAYADAYLFGIRSAYRKTFMESAPSTGEVTVESLLDFRTNVVTSGVLVKKAALAAAGNFEPERTRAHDFHLWIRMAKGGAKIGYQTTPLLKYRVRVDNLSGDSISRVEREIDVFKRIHRDLDLTAAEEAVLERRLEGLAADLSVEKGKSALISRDFRSARTAFADANRRRPSLKLSLAAIASRIAPQLLLSAYKRHRSDDIHLIRKASG